MKVFVYRNLRNRCWSVRALEGPNKGRVIQHRVALQLENCTLRVSAAGRARVLREQRKNVHAGVVGTLRTEPYVYAYAFPTGRAYYNPYMFDTFVDWETKEPLTTATLVTFNDGVVTYA